MGTGISSLKLFYVSPFFGAAKFRPLTGDGVSDRHAAAPRQSTTTHSPIVPTPSRTDIPNRAISPRAPDPVSSPDSPAPIAPSSRSKKRKSFANLSAFSFSDEDDETSFTSSRKRRRASDPSNDEAFDPVTTPSDAQSGVVNSLERPEKVKKPRKSRAKALKAKDLITQEDESVDGAQNPDPTAAMDPSESTRRDADDEPELTSKKKKKPAGKKMKTSKVVVSEGEASDGDAFAPPEDVERKDDAIEEAQPVKDETPPPVTKPKKGRNSKAKLAAQDEDDDHVAKESPTPTPPEPALPEVSCRRSEKSF